MEHTGIKPKVIEEIRTFARKYNIDKLYYLGQEPEVTTDVPVILIWLL